MKPSLPDNDMCEVITVNNYINVTCDFTDTAITGYQAILQSSSVGTLIVKQFDIGSSNSFVIFEALNNGPHSVTVFAIMDNGGLLSGGISRGVHRETINVTGTPSTSAATTDHISDPLTTTISLSTSIDVSTNGTCNSSGVYHNFIIDSHFSIISHLIDNSDNNNDNNNK